MENGEVGNTAQIQALRKVQVFEEQILLLPALA